MALVSGGRSELNPNAPIFVPAAYRQVEDFSAAWWDLVKSSAWFRHYWLSLHQDDESFDGGDDDEYVSEEDIFGDALSDSEADLEESEISEAKADTNSQEKKPRNGVDTDVKALMKNLGLSVTETPKKRLAKTAVGPAKYCEKVVPCLSPRMGPGRRIHQPR